MSKLIYASATLQFHYVSVKHARLTNDVTQTTTNVQLNRKQELTYCKTRTSIKQVQSYCVKMISVCVCVRERCRNESSFDERCRVGTGSGMWCVVWRMWEKKLAKRAWNTCGVCA